MSEEEMQELVQNAMKRFAKELKENPTNVFNYLELQKKYNQVLKDKIKIQQENQELKNLNRIYEEIISDDKENYKLLSSEIKQLKNQQKEFIEYLEEPIRLIKQGSPVNITEYTSAKLDILEEVLSKYKEIIGDKDERI